jgi:hypothetical protein
VYYNPNTAKNTLSVFNELSMETVPDFQTYNNDFVRLASEHCLPYNQWKVEFKHCLTPQLQTVLARDYTDPKVNFELFAHLGNEIWQTWKVAKKAREKVAKPKQIPSSS